MKLESVPCPLCGATETRRVFEAPALRLPDQVFTLCECLHCSLVRTTPRPVAEEMARLYGGEFYSASTHPLIAKLNRTIARERVGFVRRRRVSGKLLDVGCGTGGFLMEMARTGYDVHGLEPYQGVVEHLPIELRGKVRCAPFESVDYSAGSFDLITLFHVLEHLPAPVETLRRLRGCLKPGGLLVLEVPNFASRESSWLGTHWYNLDVPYHFWHFTPASLRTLVETAGLQLVETETAALTRPVWLLNYLLLGASAIGRHLNLPMPVCLPLCLLTRILWAGSCPMVRITCQLGTSEHVN
jgi:SAM-dependent methyltransferase